MVLSTTLHRGHFTGSMLRGMNRATRQKLQNLCPQLAVLLAPTRIAPWQEVHAPERAVATGPGAPHKPAPGPAGPHPPGPGPGGPHAPGPGPGGPHGGPGGPHAAAFGSGGPTHPGGGAG
eukprot:770538-Rhodomonas_salina.2